MRYVYDAATQKQNEILELDNIEFMCFVIHHAGWLMNYHCHHPRIIRADTMVLLLIWMGQPLLCSWKKKENEREEKNAVRCVAAATYTHTLPYQPHGIFLPPKYCTHTPYKQDECTARLPKQCKHVQLIGDESLVISFRILAWSIFIHRRQVCDARGVCMRYVYVYTLNSIQCINEIFRFVFSLSSLMVESSVDFIFSIIFSISYYVRVCCIHWFRSTSISITLFIMVPKVRIEKERREERKKERN